MPRKSAWLCIHTNEKRKGDNIQDREKKWKGGRVEHEDRKKKMERKKELNMKTERKNGKKERVEHEDRKKKWKERKS